MNSPETQSAVSSMRLLGSTMSLLQSILEHKRKNSNRSWEYQFYAIGAGSMSRPGKPQLESPEVQLLLKCGLVQYWPTSSSDTIPDDSLRLLEQDEQKANLLLKLYCDKLDGCELAMLPNDQAEPLPPDGERGRH